MTFNSKRSGRTCPSRLECAASDADCANRDLGADLRISDAYDGPETIQRVTVTLLSPAPCP